MLKRLLIAVFALVSSGGCGGGQSRSTLLRTPLGPDLKALWDAHGGLPQWEKFAGATLDYEGSGAGRLASVGKVSCKAIIEFGSSPSVVLLQEPATAAEEPGGKLAASFLASLFHLPFGLKNPGWKFRRAMILRATTNPGVEFETSRSGGGHEIGPFFFRYTQLENGLPSVYYFCRDPALGGGVYRVDFHAYKSVQGILVSTNRNHYSISEPGNSFDSIEKEPFSPHKKQASSILWTEKLSNLRFLSPKELEAALGQNSEAQ